jgi:hypothetical protein
MAAISAVWRRNFKNFRLLNSAYITPLPKKEAAVEAKDFRPTSLIHSFAKLITKILSNRLESMVSNNQSTFIKGRFIQDNFMLVQQTWRFLHSQNNQEFYSSLTYQRLLIPFLGFFSWRFGKS